MNGEAQHPGRCFECDSPIVVGDQVEYVDGWWQHSDHGEGDDTEPDPEEHTDRQAWHLEEDADMARINALMDGL